GCYGAFGVKGQGFCWGAPAGIRPAGHLRRVFAGLPARVADSETGSPRIVCAGSGLPESASVRADVGVAPGLPPREPGVSVRSAATDVPDVVRNPQPDQEHNREPDGSRGLHVQLLPLALLRCNVRSLPGAAGLRRELFWPAATV